MSDVQKKVDQAQWAVPEGWTPERLGQCGRCFDKVLYASAGGGKGTILKFDRNGEDHHYSCIGVKRQGVGRTWKGEHRATKHWERPE